ncbi:2-dehydropantoate 2-reductase [Streptomyces sp. DvalAA-14]|uniref:2-dehydropantoate 2-reductase n=1 Tax=unclassified Streptomyces TaxID=2593676 RepID=UPI00081BA8DC|nr:MULTISPECIES: 2-dehydropantoate 2-reductase [unclassified Streptomyces]MYS20087.1 2-dehydropantoate 2-reductase [Streptomyces sp. SID4948]SCD60623.1 2-dehydropantoate 2-reductase [Streptomyces sp. DvalAA-14]
MRLLIVGAGATGGFFGVKLARAGRDVTFLVHPERVADLRKNGLRLTGILGDERIDPQLTTAADLDSPYDVILLAVKATALAQSMDDIAPAVGPDTAILPILNGISHLDQLNDRFGKDKVLGGVAVLATSAERAGEINVLTSDAKLTAGDQDGASTPRTERVRELFGGAGFEFAVTDAILAAMWSKWVFIASTTAVTCLMRGTIGDVNSVPGGFAWSRSVLAEAAAVAEAANFPVGKAEFMSYQATLTEPGSSYAPSFYRDLVKGRPIEVEHVLGDFSRRAAALAVGTPFLDLATMNLRVYEQRREQSRR